jgi:hypothetical protein
MNDVEKAIEALKMDNELMQFDPNTGEDYPIELQNEINQDIYKANLVAISALEKQLNGGWIPVSERLPNNCGLGVLLTIENKFQQRKVIQGFTGYMEKGKLEFHTNDKTTNLEIWKVIAWRPLPEPYKEVENE